MKKTMSLLLATAALCSCGGNSYTLRGTIAPGRTDSVFLFAIDNREDPHLSVIPISEPTRPY